VEAVILGVRRMMRRGCAGSVRIGIIGGRQGVARKSMISARPSTPPTESV
jgi:hypothetical protein